MMFQLVSTRRYSALPRRHLGPLLAWGCAVVIFGSVATARAGSELLVDAPTLSLGEVVEGVPEELRSINLGPTPPAGSSRLLVRAELSRMLAAAGVHAGRVTLPHSVRVRTRSERWSAERLRQAVVDQGPTALPAGVRLEAVTVRLHLVLPHGTVAKRLVLPAIPKRAGQAQLAAVLLLEHDNTVIRRVPVALVVDVSEEAARPLLEKGAMVRVYIEKSSTKIAALAEALQDGEVGDTLPFRVHATRRVVQARVESKHLAKVVSR